MRDLLIKKLDSYVLAHSFRLKNEPKAKEEVKGGRNLAKEYATIQENDIAKKAFQLRLDEQVNMKRLMKVKHLFEQQSNGSASDTKGRGC